MYLEVFRSPILEAFFLTASKGLLSCAATFAVGLLEKSFLSILMSFFDHRPFVSFFDFAIFCPLSHNNRVKIYVPMFINMLYLNLRVVGRGVKGFYEV